MGFPPTYGAIACPSCGKYQYRVEHSGNDVVICSAYFYSDGWKYAPFFSHLPRPNFMKCPACGVFFKVSDSLTRDAKYEVDLSSLVRPRADGMSNLRDGVSYLSIKEYRQAINFGLYNSGPEGSEEWKEDMLLLRIELWQSYNHSIGGMENASAEQKAIYEDNCRRILSMLTGKTDSEYLLMAELHRNIGEFDKCRNLLNNINQAGIKYPLIISIIGAACDAMNMLTVRVDDPDIPMLGAICNPKFSIYTWAVG